jgi:hypothetical protein
MSAHVEADEGGVRPLFAGLMGWAVPGLGHFYAGRQARGALLGGTVWFLFLLGFFLGGHLYSLFEATSGFLSYVFGFFDLGTGALYLLSRLLGLGGEERLQESLAEYGNIFFMCAGLLNYLLALDAHDIVAGRKQ